MANRRPDAWGKPSTDRQRKKGGSDASFRAEEDEEETRHFRTKALEFRRRFDMPPEERLVNYYACSYWKSRLPRQGWLFLSVHHLCFYSFLLGKETKVALRWTDITHVERNASTLSFGNKKSAIDSKSTLNRLPHLSRV